MDVKKIAIINPYLQGGHTETAEIEAANRFILAAKRLFITAKMFAKSEDVESFDPDFIITHTYQEPKLTHYPTYGLLTMPIAWVKDVPRFVRNILTYDGFLTSSPSVINWLTDLCKRTNKSTYIAHSAFSHYQTEFVPLDFKNAIAAYLGTNWDGKRHHDLFTHSQLSDGSYLKCYGPQKSWSHYPDALYGAEVPFDGLSVLSIYAKNAVGLCVNHPDFDREGIPTSRTFEIAAASALPICSHNQFIRDAFGDAVLYIDRGLSGQELATQIIEHMKWIRSNPSIAQEMARQVHAIFCEKLSMEFFIQKIIDMHKKKHAENIDNAITNQSTIHMQYKDLAKEKVSYIINTDKKTAPEKIIQCVKQVFNQTYKNVNVIVLGKQKLLKSLKSATDFNGLDVEFFTHNENVKIQKTLSNAGTKWFGILGIDDIIFQNHISTLMKMFSDANNSLSGHKIAALYSGTLEFSAQKILQDVIVDECSIVKNDKVRVGYFGQYNNSPESKGLFYPGSLLLNLNFFDTESFLKINFHDCNAKLLLEESGVDKSVIFSPNITSACNVDVYSSRLKMRILSACLNHILKFFSIKKM